MASYTSELARELAPGLLERFERYVRLDTQSVRDRTQSPSTPGQLELGRMLARELREAGCEGAALDENGYVFATLPATTPDSPVLGLIAHMDTSPDAPGSGVEPLVHTNYDGTVIRLPRNGTELDPEMMPELRAQLGQDIITASGDTLLGADDKAGVAEIMTAVAYLGAHPELCRPTLRIAFTPDEEIGEGATLFDVAAFGAPCAFTLDGSEAGEIQDETFSAVELILRIHGVDVHPGQATGKLVNALRLVGRILTELPPDLSPEATADRVGFIHPYHLKGTSGEAELRTIVRDFDDERLEEHVNLFRQTVDRVMATQPRAEAEIDIRYQYRNMRSHIETVPYAMGAAEEAIRAEGLVPRRTAIRGGTDGSKLSEMGLPCPNLFTGGHEFHSPREWASLQDMAAAAATIVRLAEVWTRVGEIVSAP